MADEAWTYEGKHVVVTGCASGIGQATVLEAAALGAHVTGLDIKEPSVKVDAYLAVDMSDRSSIERVVGQLPGSIDALFNCAGLSGGGGPAIQVMRVNFIGLRHLTESVVSRLGPGGAIVSVASTGGMGFRDNMDHVAEFLEVVGFDEAIAWCEAHPEQFERGGYGFSKQALIVYTMRRSRDLAESGIRINCTGPGMTDTPMLEDSAKLLGREFLDRFPRPLGRDATPEEQARPLLFLNSAAASYISGQLLWVDGGLVNGLDVGTIDKALLTR